MNPKKKGSEGGQKLKKSKKEEKIKVTKTAPTPIRGTEWEKEYASQVKLLLPSGRLKVERGGEAIPVA